jgi:uncharacterized protein YcfJ
MKKSVLFAALGGMAAFAGTAGAQEIGRVLSATPVIQQVAVPRQVCSNQPMVVQQPNSGAGAVVGGIAGGAVGNTIGHGSGRAAATAIGIIGGALLGNNIEGSGRQVQNVQQCSTQTSYENRTMGYDVVYEYAGREYNTQMPYDPGPTIRVQVTPLGANEGPPDTAGYGVPYGQGQQGMAPPPVQQVQSVQPAVVAGAVAPGYPAYGAPAYPVYAPAPFYPAYGPAPIGLSLGIGFSSGGHRHHGR